MLRHLIFCCPSGLLCIFSKCLHHFSFHCPSGLLCIFSKCLHHFSFRCPNGLFCIFSKCLHHFSGILVGGPWGPIGNSLGSLPLGFFFWGVPPFRDFGYTLKWSFLKVDPVLSIWVFLISSFGFHGFMLNHTVDKIQNVSRQRNFNLIFLLYKFFELLPLLLKFKGILLNLWFLFFDLFLNKVCFVFHVFAQSMRV